MRTLLVWMIAAPLWAATATKDQSSGKEWESMPKEAVTQEVTAASAAAPATAEAAAPVAAAVAGASKPVEVETEREADLIPMPLRIAAGLAVAAMVAYVIVARLS
ncbi:MAG: hypothetical protein JNK48_26220 [Bryobacterales bacterium]|nr:hypothetical protein [Bryobacterales bacterium]